MEQTQLSREDWKWRLQEHRRRLLPYVQERLNRQMRREKHPIYDFLFEYYSFRPAQLLRWSPGINVVLEGAKPDELEWGRLFQETDNGLILQGNTFPQHRFDFVKWAFGYLQGIRERIPSFHCFGLHEWAMVYREREIRHGSTPLRLTSTEIAQVVESQELCCTHFDAYRFFSEAAMPRNRLALTRINTDEYDQRGCVHVNMDLYKFAYKIAPWCSSELLAETFLFAWEARQLDMKASPYDLRSYGLEPIAIETREGRERYIEMQKELARKGIPLREKLMETYQQLITGVCTKF